MSLCARRDAVTGRLSDIGDRELGPGDVPLSAPPQSYGPWSYDAANMLAVPATLTPKERLAAIPLEAHVVHAIAFRLSTAWATATPAQKLFAQDALDAAGAQIAKTLPTV